MEPIKDGLKCWLEGSDLTSSSTNWNDRSGNNNNFSITGTPVAQNNMAVFSGDWYAKIDNLNINYGTIELTASFSSDVVNDNIYAYGSWEVNNCKYGLGNYRIVARSKNNNSTTIFSKLLSSDINKLRTYGITFNENTCVIYYEGQIIETIKSTNMPNIISFYLGYKSDSNKKGIGNIKSLKIYDRKLEPYEILANYQYELLNRNSNSYVNENNLPKIVDKLSNASNIKITGNKYGNRVQTVIDKIVEKADDITKAIKQEVINDSYSFKVGTGNVDVSADVEDGFGEVGIKGVTYQNLIIPNSMTKPNNVIIDGDIVTLLDSYNTFEGITYKALTKKNTTYTVVLDVKELFKDGIGYKIQINDGAYLYNEPLKPGINVIKIATKENGDNYHIAILKVSTAVGSMKFSKNILLLEGDHTNNPNLPSYFEGIVGVGDKSKNLFNIKDFVEFAKDTTESPFYYPITLEANTQYTFSDSTGMWNGCGFFLELLTDEKEKLFNLIDSNLANRNKFTFTTNAKTQYLLKLYKHNVDKMLSLSTNFQLEKGSAATTYEPYHDGHKIEILSCGKNLVDINKITKSHSNNTFEIIGDRIKYTGYGISNFTQPRIPIYVKPNSDIIFTCKSVENTNVYVKLVTPNKEALYTNYDFKNNTVVTKNVANNTMIYLELGKHRTDLNDIIIYDIQIEESTQATQYNSYVSDKTQILLDEPLMRLPSGVCDEITRDGKLIRRVGKIIFNGSENWKTAINNNKSRFDLSLNSVKTPSTWSDTAVPNMICSNLNVQPFKQIYTQGESGINYYHANSDRLIVASLGNSCSLVEFKQWLSQNPTTVYYELAEPIITELPAPYLRIFKDGHLTFNTLVAPESNHVVQLNKSGQIQNAIKESQSLDNRINVLENNYDNLMLSTISRLNNLELDYTLK